MSQKETQTKQKMTQNVLSLYSIKTITENLMLIILNLCYSFQM